MAFRKNSDKARMTELLIASNRDAALAKQVADARQLLLAAFRAAASAGLVVECVVNAAAGDGLLPKIYRPIKHSIGSPERR